MATPYSRGSVTQSRLSHTVAAQNGWSRLSQTDAAESRCRRDGMLEKRFEEEEGIGPEEAEQGLVLLVALVDLEGKGLRGSRARQARKNCGTRRALSRVIGEERAEVLLFLLDDGVKSAQKPPGCAGKDRLGGGDEDNRATAVDVPM